jgi:acyl-lipid omega-6 desaturase (Delta-12 desaturase)
MPGTAHERQLLSCCCALCSVEFLCHDINVHVPHHVNSKIPWYNLRMATDALRKYYGEVSCPCGLPSALYRQTSR